MIVEIIQMVVYMLHCQLQFFSYMLVLRVPKIMLVNFIVCTNFNQLYFTSASFLTSYLVSFNMKGLVEYLTGEENVLDRLGKGGWS